MRKTFSSSFAGTTVQGDEGNAGILKKFSISDQAVPLDRIRAFLTGRYGERFDVDPTVFENVVASVYSDHGYRARVTGCSGDGGVDVVLDGPDNSIIAVQVKRVRGKIEAEQVRAFVGALVLKGLTQGIFVSTSSYRKGARETAARAAERGIRVELVNAARFYDALGISQRHAYSELRDRTAPFAQAPLIDLIGRKSDKSRGTLPGCHF